MTATGFHSTWHGARMDPQFKQKLAAFLITRGPHCYYGPSDLYDGMAVPNMSYPELHRIDLGGAPIGDGHVVSGLSHVFERRFPNFTVRLDCASFSANFTKTSGMTRTPIE